MKPGVVRPEARREWRLRPPLAHRRRAGLHLHNEKIASNGAWGAVRGKNRWSREQMVSSASTTLAVCDSKIEPATSKRHFVQRTHA